MSMEIREFEHLVFSCKWLLDRCEDELDERERLVINFLVNRSINRIDQLIGDEIGRAHV